MNILTSNKILFPAKNMAHRAIVMGGTCTGEHGVGVGMYDFETFYFIIKYYYYLYLGKIDLLRLEMGEGSMQLMELIKKSIDPHNIMNPGKVLIVDDNDKVIKKYSEFCC
jgi:D-lactate dehydrogenase (cytochrome)